MDVRPRPNACFSRISSALTELMGRDIRANDPRMSAGYPSQKLPLWADFSVLNNDGLFCKDPFSERPPFSEPDPKIKRFGFPFNGFEALALSVGLLSESPPRIPLGPLGLHNTLLS